MKKILNFIIIITCLTLLIGCAKRTFHINSDPTNAKLHYQTNRDKFFKGFTPISFTEKIHNLSPSSLVIVEKEGYKPRVVNIAGFPGTDVSLQLILEKKKKEDDIKPISLPKPEFIEEKKEEKKEEAPPLEPEKEPEIAKEETLTVDEGVQELIPEAPKKEEPATPKEDSEEFVALQNKLAEMENLLSKMKGQEEPKEKLELKPSEETSIPTEEQLIQSNLNKSLAHLFRAQKFVADGRYNDALIETYKAIAINSKFAYAYALQGSIFFLKKDYYSAVKSWEKASELDPRNVEVVNILQSVKARLGKNF